MQGWSFNFGPGGFVTPEQMEQMKRQQQQQEAQIRQMIDDKRCEFCQNTYLINDQITFCNFSKECVDGMNGQHCEHWELLNTIGVI